MIENKFNELGLSNEVLKAIEDMGFSKPSKIQEEAIPVLLTGVDVIGQAQTGTGKTLAFGSVLLSKITPSQRKLPQAIILSPTRELAMQIHEEMERIGKYNGSRITCVYGGSDIERQIRTIKKGIDIIVGTPGRVMDLMRRNVLKLNDVKFVVLDEADEMLNMGFIESVQSIFNYFPGNKITCLFSATMPQPIQELAEGFMKEPKLITLAEETTVNAAITHYAYEVKEKQKLSFLKQLLCKEQPASCIIFARTQEGVKTICDELYALDMCVDKLHGGMLQEDRIENIRDFKRGKIRILVATDVAARGIDVQDISHIINYDMPNQKETYLHRIGRTGRQRASGKAITLINEYDGERKAELEDYLGYPLEIRERGEISNQDVTKETIEPLTKPFALREDKGKEVHKDTMKLYLNGGKTKKIRAGDIVGAICEIQGVSAEDIGVIQIQDNQSYVDILNGKGKQVLKTLQQSTIKGKKLKVQKAKEQGE